MTTFGKKLTNTLGAWKDSAVVTADETKSKGVEEFVDKLTKDLASEHYRLLCKPRRSGGVNVTLGSAAEANTNGDLGMLDVVFPEIDLFPGVTARPQSCIRLEFKKI